MLIAELECIAIFQFAKREPFGLHNTVFGKLQPTLITVSLFQKGESSFFSALGRFTRYDISVNLSNSCNAV